MADRDDAKFLEVVGRQTGKNYRRTSFSQNAAAYVQAPAVAANPRPPSPPPSLALFLAKRWWT